MSHRNSPDEHEHAQDQEIGPSSDKSHRPGIASERGESDEVCPLESDETASFYGQASSLARRLIKFRLEKLVEELWGNPLFGPEHFNAIHEAIGVVLQESDTEEPDSFEADGVDETLVPHRGALLGGYRIESLVGRGGVGNVYLARSPNGERVAIKLLRERRFAKRFEREIQLIQRLAHPNIVVAYKAGTYRGQSYLAMEYLPGPNLSQYVRRTGVLPWRASVNVIYQAALGLQHAHHRGLVHRDIKPANLMFDGDQIKVMDLGLAAGEIGGANVEDEQTKLDYLGGTPGYMSPEQAESLALATERSDVFSLGMTWHYLLTGESRNPGEDTGEKILKLRRNELNPLPEGLCPTEVGSILIHMTKHDPEQRLQSMAELIAALEPHVSEKDFATALKGTPAIRVLVVEDQSEDLYFTLETLRRSNEVIETSEVTTLAGALSAIESANDPFDAVLLDLDLIDSEGASTVRRLRSVATDVPLIVLTGNDDLEVGRACIEAGADEYVCKSELTAGRLERSIFITESRVRRRGASSQ